MDNKESSQKANSSQNMKGDDGPFNVSEPLQSSDKTSTCPQKDGPLLESTDAVEQTLYPRSDSILSRDSLPEEEEDLDKLREQHRDRERQRARNMSILYMEEASMEACLSSLGTLQEDENDKATVKLEPNGPMGRKRTDLSSSEVVVVQNKDLDGYLEEDKEGSAELDSSERTVAKSITRSFSPVPEADRKLRAPSHAVGDKPSAVHRREKFVRSKSFVPMQTVSEVLAGCGLHIVGTSMLDWEALQYLFEGFCEPRIEGFAFKDILQMEDSKTYNDGGIALPEQPTINMIEEKNRIVTLLTATINSRSAFILLPPHFAAAFLRTLVRLLTNETDVEYNQACSITPEKVEIDWDNLESPAPHPDHPSNRPHLLYNSARFQCTRNWGASDSACDYEQVGPESVLRLWEMVVLKTTHQQLVGPLARLLGVLSTAGINPRLLRQMLSLCQNSSLSTFARLAMTRCLATAAIGSARPTLPKSPPRHFFIFGGKGMRRTVSGLTSWPFRNDFGLATWFRADRFDHRSSVLFSARVADGGGIVVALVPLDDNSTGASVEVHIYDSGKQQPSHRARVGQCILLPRVWYHLAVRHTRSRLKGVFSLSTRQQLSVMLDGKVMHVDSLSFPKIHDFDLENESILQASIRRATSRSVFDLNLDFGDGFVGQTGAVHIFHDNVSDASLRALYEVSGGNKSKMKKISGPGNWDSRRSDLVRKTLALDKKMTNDDAEEIVLAQRRSSVARQRKMMTTAVDLRDAEDTETTIIPLELQKPAFGSKLFVVWDPRRAISSRFIVESHIGAHLQLEHAYCWDAIGAQNVIQSVGGVQALVPFFRAVAQGAEAEPNDGGIRDKALPNLLSLLSCFLIDNDENAREFLRCGALDVIEQVLVACRQGYVESQPTDGMFAALVVNQEHAREFLQRLLQLRAGCSHYIGLETKVFSRLIFNIPLWFGAGDRFDSALEIVMMPALASLTRGAPGKIRDCLSLKEVVEVIHGFFKLELRGVAHDLERVEDTLLGIVFESLAAGTSPRDLAPFLNLLSVSLDAETWEPLLPQRVAACDEKTETPLRFIVKSSTILCMLFQIRPVIPGLFESFAHCCGSVQGGAAWIMSAMVNSVSDDIRSLGIRCIALYLDIVSDGADSALSLGHQFAPDTNDPSQTAVVSSSVRRGATRLSQFAKDLAMGPSKGGVSTSVSARLTVRVVFKLLWHLLRTQPHLGERTRASLLFWMTHKPDLNLSSVAGLDTLRKSFVVEDHGFRISLHFAESCFSESGKANGRLLQHPQAVGTVLRVLRYVDDTSKDIWIADLLHFATSSRSSVSLFASVVDWSVSLFHLLSDTLEACNSAHRAHMKQKDPGAEQPISIRSKTDVCVSNEEVLLLDRRLDRLLDLFAMILGHTMREGGDKALAAVEGVAALQRVCVNGQTVFLLLLSRICTDLFDHGTLLELDSISAEDWKDVDLEKDSLPLKQSARRVTDAILSNGTAGLDITVAVRSWRSLRHLVDIVGAVSSKNRLDISCLFDYGNQSAAAVDEVSRGLYGIRLPDSKISHVSSAEYVKLFLFAESKGQGDIIDRSLCVNIAAQILVLLDAFMFPASLDASLPTSQIHGLTLVRDSEPRLGTSQGPLICSAIRLSVLLLSMLEPSSIAFLQSAGRLRSLLFWALELLRERSSQNGSQKTNFRGDEGMIDRLVLASVLHCHRALGRCTALLLELESAPFHQYFKHKEEQKKHLRRILRVSLELRDIVSTAYRGRCEALEAALSARAFEELKISLENSNSIDKAASKESYAREFLSSGWVTKFQDTETRAELAVPEQVAMDTIPLSSNQMSETTSQGFVAVENLSLEAEAIVADFERALNAPFEAYLENQRKWAETDAVRDLEYDGDNITSRLSSRREADAADHLNSLAKRRNRADFRWNRMKAKCLGPWQQESHWKLAEYTDRVGRRILLVPNHDFDNHRESSYENSVGIESNSTQTQKPELQAKASDLTEVIRRNADAFIMDGSTTSTEAETMDDEGSFQVSDSENSNGEVDSHNSEAASSEGMSVKKLQSEAQKFEDFELDAEWDKIGNEELDNIGTDGDVDGWARAFIWENEEVVVARFESVMIVSLRSYVLGKILLTSNGIYFRQIGDEINGLTKQPVKVGDVGVQDAKDKRWRLSRLVEVHGRRYMLRQQALELFFSDSCELFLNFTNGTKDRDRFYAKLRNSCKIPLLSSPKSLSPRTVFRRTKLNELWRRRKLSNFEYLMALNRMAGRSFNDVTQYPVMPWVLADYTSDEIDLNDSRVYRDLSKPVGALNPDRLAQLLERYNELELFGFSEAEKFLYGSHYSSPGIVLHYLIRQEPFTSMAIDLQSGRFDCPDRLFFDVAASWTGCLTSTSDMKELIPEFFSLPEMFLNSNRFPLGVTQAEITVDNVRLPPWAKGSAYEFVRVNRLALESDYVSQNLHHWIDLIFGYKQRGPEAESAHNVFHHLSYEGSVDLDKISDEVDRIAAESHIQNFGQTPSQLLVVEPHVARLSIEDSWASFLPASRKVPTLRCYTPARQFANSRMNLGKGGLLRLEVMSDTVLAIYSDMSIGTYKWFPTGRANRLRMDKLRPADGRLCSISRSATKRGSAIPQDLIGRSGVDLASSSIALTIGGKALEALRRKSLYNSSRLMAGSEVTLSSAEASSLILSCGYWDNCVRACKLESAKVVACNDGGHRGPVRCLAVDDDKAIMVTGGQDCTCRVWVIDHPDLAVALSDGYVQTSLGSCVSTDELLSCCHVLWGHETPVSAVCVSSALDVSVSGDLAGKICVHTLRKGDCVRFFYPPPTAVASKLAGSVTSMALHSCGTLAVHTQDGGLHGYTLNGVRRCSIQSGDVLNDMKFTWDGEHIVTGGNACQVLIRSIKDLQLVSSLDLMRHGPIRCLSLSPGSLNPIGQYLFVGSDDGMITIVDHDSDSDNKDSVHL